MKNKQIFSMRLSFGILIFSAVCAVLSLARWAGPYARQTSRLRQLDGALLPALTAICIVAAFAILLVSHWKKTSGRYACFGFSLWGVALLLYGLITPYRIMKVLYAPFIQKLAIRTGLPIDVTTIQAVKTAADALNLLACALAVILGAAAIISLARKAGQAQEKESLTFPCLLAGALGISACYTLLPLFLSRFGYSALFCLLAALMIFSSLVAWRLLRNRNDAERTIDKKNR